MNQRKSMPEFNFIKTYSVFCSVLAIVENQGQNPAVEHKYHEDKFTYMMTQL